MEDYYEIIYERSEIDNLFILKKNYKKYGLVVLKNFFAEIYENYNKDLQKIIRLAYKNKM